MSIGTLENIATQLTELNANLLKVLSTDTGAPTPPKPARAKPAKVEPVADEEPAAEDEDETPAPAPAKKAVAKKAAAKATPKKAAKPKADDLSNMTIFKKKLFEAAESSGIPDVMPKLKAYLKSQNYSASDEIEVDDRADFVAGVKEHFAELANGMDDTSEEDEIDI